LKYNKRHIILGAVILLIIVILVVLNVFTQPKNQADEKQKDLFYKKIETKKINPTGTHLLYKLLEKYDNTTSIRRIQTSYFTTLKEKLPLENKRKEKNIYISIGDKFNLSSEDNEHLFEFIYEGNQALIVTENLHSDFLEYLLPNSEVPFYIVGDTSITLNYLHPNFEKYSGIILTNPNLNFHYHPLYKQWRVFNEDALLNSATPIIYDDDDNYVCVQVNYGKGKMIFCTLPDAFSNAFVATKKGKLNAEIIFSHLDKGNIYWHENFGAYSSYRGDSNPNKLNKPSEYSKSSPLQFILKIPTLTIALILALVGILFYMLVKSKRKQRIIPPIESDKNTSLEFVEVIAKLYQQQRKHEKLIVHIERNLIDFVKHRYYLNFTKIDANTIEKIALKSNLEKNFLVDLFQSLKQLQKKHVSDKELITLHKKVEKFYRECQ